MIPLFWLEVIRNLTDEQLSEWALAKRSFIGYAPQFLSPFPDEDPRGSPELKKSIEMAREDLDLVLEEMERRKKPGPRDWSPRGTAGIRK
jgi:hypothetical protein